MALTLLLLYLRPMTAWGWVALRAFAERRRLFAHAEPLRRKATACNNSAIRR